MNNTLKKINNSVENWFDKQNTNTSAMIIFDLIYEFSLSEEKPYTKIKTAYNKFESINIKLLREKNRETYEVITNIISILEGNNDVIARLTNDLNEHKSLKDYYRCILQAYNNEIFQDSIETKIVKSKNKQLVLKSNIQH